ncbi:immunoglobulin lambda-1 light chain-like [Tupaia chinensis]|uniref:immunoglobulin lambda-1 light chain-like n=1 Tax=Tupaia chinensis TaxID=246437 RepID=UPI0003C90567|nr:immunoglobulin lambda-1 light chain-like [Tupaia chinensis]
MAWSPLLLTLLAHCTVSWAQSVLTQTPLVSGPPGQRVTISCSGHSNNFGSGYSVHWYQQLPGMAPRLIYEDTERPSGAPDRFSSSRFGTSASLTISGLQAEDEADYHCQSWDGNTDVPTVLWTRGKPVLTQPPSLSASPGGSARLTCTLSSNFGLINNNMSWYQQRPVNPLQYLLRFKSDSNKHQGPGVPSHFSASKDVSASTGVLHISGLQPEDEADYYCVTWRDSLNDHTVPRHMGK